MGVGYIKIFVKSSNKVLLNNLINNNIEVRKFLINNDGCTFYIKEKDYEKLQIMLNKNQKSCTTLEDKSKYTYKKNFKRIGLYLGVVTILCLLVTYSMLMTRIEVSGNSIIDSKQILTTIELPVLKKDIDKLDIQKNILNIEGVASASVEIIGNTIKVNVVEELEKKPLAPPLGEVDINSNYDAIITKIICYAGTPVLRVGDTVRKGQTIISKECKLPDDTLTTQPTYGVVYGRVWVTKKMIIEDIHTSFVRTGKYERVVSSWGYDKPINTSFTYYEVEENTTNLLSVCPIPLTYTTVFELEKKQVKTDVESIIFKEKERIEKEFSEDVIPKKFWYDIKTVDKKTQIDIYYEIECEIT